MDSASFLWALVAIFASIRNLIPPEWYEFVSSFFDYYYEKFVFYHFVDINEETGSAGGYNDLYNAAELYLASFAAKSSTSMVDASCGRRDSSTISFTLSPHGQVYDSYNGAQIHWRHSVHEVKAEWSVEIKRKFTVRVFRRNKDLVTPYLKHVLEEGRLAQLQQKKKKLYTNVGSRWRSDVYFPPSTLNSIAMDSNKKEALVSDLQAFMKGKDFFGRVGRAWKRGYLLYGPPGTGKSSLIGAISNFTGYHVYDLELTMVRNNSELRKLLIDVKNKAIIVVEDIDCSLHLEDRTQSKNIADDEQKEAETKEREKEKEKGSKVTLSGMLNFVDGLWSSCGSERIFIFTTNYVDRLDPALIRPGRMDIHIYMTFCTFPMFKTLASNYLRIEEHHLFARIEELVASVEVSAAQISEVLVRHYNDPDLALEKLVEMVERTMLNPPKATPLSKQVNGEDLGNTDSDSSYGDEDDDDEEDED